MILPERDLFLSSRQLILFLVDEQRLVRERLARDHVRVLHARVHKHVIVESRRHLRQIGGWQVFFHEMNEPLHFGSCEMILRLNLINYSI